MDNRTTFVGWVRGIADVFAAKGLDVRALFLDAGIDLDSMNNPDTRYPTENISLLWQLAESRSGDPAIGLAAAQVKPSDLTVVGYTMMSCPNLHVALGRLMRYLRIVSNAASVTMTEEATGYRVTLELFGGARPVPRQRYEYAILSVLRFCGWMFARELRPVIAEFAYPAPLDPRPYEEALGCPLKFNAPVNSVVMSRADMMMPLPTSSQMLAELHERIAGEYLERLDNAPVSYKVRDLFIRMLPGGEPRREDVASALFMSERTLQRRLQEEGSSFHELLDVTRRELAQQFLAKPSLSLAQAAYLLGFADHSNFFRACKRWFGVSPSQYRSQMSAKAAETSPAR